MCAEIKAMTYTRISKIGNSFTIVTANFLSALDSACLLYLLSSLLHQLERKVLLATLGVQPRLLLQEVAGMSSPPKENGSSWLLIHHVPADGATTW